MTSLGEACVHRSKRQYSKPTPPESAESLLRQLQNITHQSAASKTSKPLRSRPEQAADSKSDNVVIVNRALVLQLWSACVRQLSCPDLEWAICLSAGSVVFPICAVSKDRRLGMLLRKMEMLKCGKQRTRRSRSCNSSSGSKIYGGCEKRYKGKGGLRRDVACMTFLHVEKK